MWIPPCERGRCLAPRHGRRDGRKEQDMRGVEETGWVAFAVPLDLWGESKEGKEGARVTPRIEL